MDPRDAQWSIMEPFFTPTPKLEKRGRPPQEARAVAEWIVVGVANRSTVAGFAETLSAVPDLSSVVSAVAAGRHVGRSITGLGGGFAGSRQGGFAGELHRWLLRRSEKGGSGVGKTKRGKGTKIMAIADRHGLPIGISVGSAPPHETKLVE